MIRGDLSNRLIHLTKGKTPDEAAGNFLNIMKERKLRGGSSSIRGGYECVCFSEAPISVLSQMLAARTVNGMPYAPLGVMVSKSWLFQQGGRPVIYQAEDEYDLLPEKLKFRHVRYEPSKGIDHTWEREWRIRTEELHLDPNSTTLVVPRRDWEEKFKDQHTNDQKSAGLLFEENGWLYIQKFPWHFIVLEDLGVDVACS